MSQSAERKGQISVKTADIFPIIKKWLYSEHDIFLRELIANATDAITKRATVARTKNVEIPAGKITVEIDRPQKKIIIHDNGIGMTENEVEKYIAQLAFSGAEEFVKKMKDAGTDPAQQIIGKFGLGFFSVFMVAKKVELETLSYEEDAAPTKWICEGETDYTFKPSEKKEIGTSITLFVGEDGEEFLDSYKVQETLRNFCDFMPYKITVYDTEKIAKEAKDNEEKKKDEEKHYYAAEGTVINDSEPLWKKDPTTLKDEDYTNFYQRLFPMDAPPLFWLHLKIDHPFTLEGILYFPKLNPNKPFNERNIRLYCKQVFVSDNVKNIIPDFLVLLKGAIDSTDIPLNVSRSSLQGDPNVKKISNYIIKKVAESLKKLYNNDRVKFESIWDDIGIFVKYGCVSDSKFDELMREMVLFKNSEGKFMTLNEYTESIPEAHKEKLKGKVLYSEKDKSHNALKKQLLAEKIFTVDTDDHIDPHFMQHVEYKGLGEKFEDLKLKFVAMDSEISNLLGTENATEDDGKVKDMFTAYLAPETKTDKPDIEIGKVKNSTIPAYYRTDEQMKRYAQMAKAMGQGAAFPIKKTLVINPANSIVKLALGLWQKGEQKELAEKICHHVSDLASISSEGLKAEEKDQFVERSQHLIEELAKGLHY